MQATLFFASLAPLLPSPQEPAAGDPFQRHELENGVRVCILHAKDAPRQSTFTLLPLGFVTDGEGKAQYAHLVEHLLIRAVDPEGFEADGALINGETMASTLRVETLAPVERWRESIARQGRWLAAGPFDEAALEREKGRIAEEVENTVAGGFTHKWADAAWTQVVLHGQEHAAVRGDVASATLESATAYVRERAGLGQGALVVSAGPVDPAEVLEALRGELGKLAEKKASAAIVEPDAWKPGDREATWDLDARHYLEWYALPGEGADERAEGLVLARAVHLQLAMARKSLPTGAQVLANVLRLSPKERGLLISISLPAETDVAKVRQSVRTALDGALSKSSLSFAAHALANELALPDFAAQREQLAGRRGADLIEAQVALNYANLELQLDLTLPEILEVLAALDAERLVALGKKHLEPSKRCSLALDSRE